MTEEVAAKTSKRGVGQCGDPHCSEPKLAGSHMCEEHYPLMAQIREELETDPKLIHHRRSDSPYKSWTQVSDVTSRVKICAAMGCFEVRVPPSAYCPQHESETSDQ